MKRVFLAVVSVFIGGVFGIPTATVEESCAGCADNCGFSGPVDVVFAVDISGKMKQLNRYESEKEFVKSVINKLELGDDKVKTAAVPFNHRVRPGWTFNDQAATDYGAACDAVDNFFPPQGDTHTEDGLKKSSRYFSNHGRGEGACPILVLITGAGSDNPSAVEEEAEAFHDTNIKVCLVPVGVQNDQATQEVNLLVGGGEIMPNLGDLNDLSSMVDETVACISRCPTLPIPNESILGGNPGVLVADQTLDDLVFFDIVTNISTRMNMSGLSTPADVAVDPVEGYLFIANWGSNSGYILRTRLDGSEHEIIADSSRAPRPARLALDPINQHVYFTDWTLGKIISIDYGGNTEIYVLGTENGPTGLTLDLSKSLVYWSYWNGGISVAPMNTSNTVVLKTNSNFGIVPGLDLDTSGSVIYFCEYAFSQYEVSSLTVDGSSVVRLANMEHIYMIELVAYGDHIYGVHTGLPYIEVMPKSGGSLERLGEGDYLSYPYGMTFYAPSR